MPGPGGRQLQTTQPEAVEVIVIIDGEEIILDEELEGQIKEVVADLSQLESERAVIGDRYYEIKNKNVKLRLEFLSIITQIYL